MLNNSGKSGHTCLVNIRGKAFCLWPLCFQQQGHNHVKSYQYTHCNKTLSLTVLFGQVRQKWWCMKSKFPYNCNCNVIWKRGIPIADKVTRHCWYCCGPRQHKIEGNSRFQLEISLTISFFYLMSPVKIACLGRKARDHRDVWSGFLEWKLAILGCCGRRSYALPVTPYIALFPRWVSGSCRLSEPAGGTPFTLEKAVRLVPHVQVEGVGRRPLVWGAKAPASPSPPPAAPSPQPLAAALCKAADEKETPVDLTLPQPPVPPGLATTNWAAKC